MLVSRDGRKTPRADYLPLKLRMENIFENEGKAFLIGPLQVIDGKKKSLAMT